MKKLTLPMLMTIALLVSGAIIFSSCTKEGPEGPAGANGVDGADGNATCGQCHDLSAQLVAIIGQYNNSFHGTGPDHERNGTSCAPCHTHQGFLEVLATGLDETAADIENPARINCRTCHKIHETYTAADYGLRATGPVTLHIHDDVVDFGKGNSCVGCHQGRAFSDGQEPDPLALTDSVTFTSSRFGVHHGPQGNILGGVGGFEIPGSMSYTTPAAHTSITDGCVQCHMATAFGYAAGGHTWWMEYEYHGATEPNMAGCDVTGCHPGEEDFDINGVMTQIHELHDSLGNVLINLGIMTPTFSAVPGTWTNLHAGGVWTHQMIREDRSFGVHNPKYTKALLINVLESL
ncbi:hypothetical protein ACFL6I_26670 [candidate division KSB1 bacterium]